MEPSKQDMLLTKRVKEAGNLLGIELLDHLIISDGTYYSFKEENQL
ncbi:JAB domain-containing protein [Vagococcus fluvialis]